MAKQKITDLLRNELTESASIKPTEIQTADAVLPKPLDDGQSITEQSSQQSLAREQTMDKVTESVSSALTKYLTLERKEVRLPSEHLDELTRLARRLNRARQGSGEENTLIRVAIAALINHADQLEGTTEQALLDAWETFVA